MARNVPSSNEPKGNSSGDDTSSGFISVGRKCVPFSNSFDCLSVGSAVNGNQSEREIWAENVDADHGSDLPMSPPNANGTDWSFDVFFEQDVIDAINEDKQMREEKASSELSRNENSTITNSNSSSSSLQQNMTKSKKEWYLLMEIEETEMPNDDFKNQTSESFAKLTGWELIHTAALEGPVAGDIQVAAENQDLAHQNSPVTQQISSKIRRSRNKPRILDPVPAPYTTTLRDKPYKCPAVGCTKRYKIRHQYYDHYRRVHINIREFLCDNCHLRFHTSAGLRRHVLDIHKRFNPYKCQLCSAQFPRVYFLRNHYVTKHPNNSSALVEALPKQKKMKNYNVNEVKVII